MRDKWIYDGSDALTVYISSILLSAEYDWCIGCCIKSRVIQCQPLSFLRKLSYKSTFDSHVCCTTKRRKTHFMSYISWFSRTQSKMICWGARCYSVYLLLSFWSLLEHFESCEKIFSCTFFKNWSPHFPNPII